MKKTAQTSPVARALFLLATFFAGSTAAFAEDLHVVRTLMSITAARFGNFWPNPTASEPNYNTWSWLPRTSFYLKGDLPPGGQVTIVYMLPDGSPWISVPVVANKIGETNYYTCGNDYSTQEAGKPAKILTGTFPFKITLQDPLAGSTKELYSGKYTVGKFHKGPDGAEFKNQNEYYVDQDWRLPMAFIAPNYSGAFSDNPVLEIKLYLKGEVDTQKLEGVLFFEDKMIASKEMRGGSSYNPFKLQTSGMDTGDPLWSLFNFSWAEVRMSVPTNKVESTWYLSEHPGKYELKVLRNGTLARSVKFTIGEKGAIVDGGLAKAAADEVNAIFPVKVLGTTDGSWDSSAWKAGAFYGNPLPDFDGS